MLKTHGDKINLRKLNWSNVKHMNEARLHHDYISCHWYSRRHEANANAKANAKAKAKPFNSKSNININNSNSNPTMKMHFC
jgi:beta-galactosidase beta subunit